jgi:hypothetical protein
MMHKRKPTHPGATLREDAKVFLIGLQFSLQASIIDSVKTRLCQEQTLEVSI